MQENDGICDGKRIAHNVVVLDPYSRCARPVPDGLNPMGFFDGPDPAMVEECRALCEALRKRWENQSGGDEDAEAR